MAGWCAEKGGTLDRYWDGSKDRWVFSAAFRIRVL